MGEPLPGPAPPRVAILGAGPAGLGAAFRLTRGGLARVTVVEQREAVGGNAGSFEIAGQRVDYGSHRLHPACDPRILADVRDLLGEDLVIRPRHGRILLRGRWIHFPLRAAELLLRLDGPFALGAARDMLVRLRPRGGEEETFAAVLERRLGPTISRHFYFPYARKIWGLEPEELSAEQARRRIAADSFWKLLRKALSRFPGVRPVGFRHFFYPRRGYGAISEAYARAAAEGGAELALGWRVAGLEAPPSEGAPWRVVVERDGERRVVEADHVWSTIPVTVLAGLVRPSAPEAVLRAAAGIRYRAMLLVYLTLEADRYTEYDAHYFPGPEIPLTRLSEPKNYAGTGEPRGRTTLCGELPCSPDDAWWSMEDAEVGRRIAEGLVGVGLPPPGPLSGVTVRRLRYAYPVYSVGYEARFRRVDRWIAGLPRLLSFGRQGLFAHDNTHHALFMAYAAADCLSAGGFDGARWAAYRRVFESHVVED